MQPARGRRRLQPDDQAAALVVGEEPAHHAAQAGVGANPFTLGAALPRLIAAPFEVADQLADRGFVERELADGLQTIVHAHDRKGVRAQIDGGCALVGAVDGPRDQIAGRRFAATSVASEALGRGGFGAGFGLVCADDS